MRIYLDRSGQAKPDATHCHHRTLLSQPHRNWGIDGSVQVVAYDDVGGAIAGRLWWMLRWLGHDQVAVLDGDWRAWQREGRPISDGHEKRTPRSFSAQPRLGLQASADDVLASLHDPVVKLFDARATDRYRGENETLDSKSGHIPGADSAPFMNNLTPDGFFLPAATLRKQYETLLGGAPADRSIFYCGSGVTAAHDLLAVAHAGLGDARLYAGSWSEWITDPVTPHCHRRTCVGRCDMELYEATRVSRKSLLMNTDKNILCTGRHLSVDWQWRWAHLVRTPWRAGLAQIFWRHMRLACATSSITRWRCLALLLLCPAGLIPVCQPWPDGYLLPAS